MILITGANRGIGAALLAGYRAAGSPAQGTARHPAGDLLPLDVTAPASLAALARHLADSRRNGLPTTLLFDEASLRKPFFEDFRESFDECLPAREAASLFGTEMAGS